MGLRVLILKTMNEFTHNDVDYMYQAVGSIITMIFTNDRIPSLVTDAGVRLAAKEDLAARLQEQFNVNQGEIGGVLDE